MCGFAGFLVPTGFGADVARATAARMGDVIRHRGPDDGGIWLDAAAGIALSHRRLAIVDLSPAGHQPMSSASGRHVIAFNGEIYNHLEMRARLEAEGLACAWRGHSDTETLLAAIDAWGLQAALTAAVGMFALALWDRQLRTLHLARDRAGEKPLYFGWQGEGHARALLFGSELKALRAHPAFAAAVDRDALVQFMRHGYVPAPRSIHRGISKVMPGMVVTIDASGAVTRNEAFWSATQAMLDGTANSLVLPEQEAVNELERVLRSAVAGQMVADVPLGAFLSGGIDSSTVVALMQAQSSRPVRTFSIGFHEEGFNEAEHAKAVAAHLGTDHTELYVTAQQAMDVVPLLPSMYDEPFGDSSQIPTRLVSHLAKQHVTVALSGDAGDELFGGYSRYAITQRLWGKLSRIPLPLRRAIASALRSLPETAWNRLAAFGPGGLRGSNGYARLGEKIHKGARAMCSPALDALYLELVSQWSDPASLVRGGTEPATVLTQADPALASLAGVPRMMALDLLTYLPDDILAKVDRAAMSVSLETRVPMLDHRVIEFAWRLPMEHKIRDGVSKWALRQVLYRHVPRALLERPKMGFGVPIDHWLRGPLRDWAEALLDPRQLEAGGLLDPAPVRRAWAEHLQGVANRQHQLWNVLMFQAWKQSVDADRNAPR
ncbi:asparagine synthase (glutamine-hydrolyzing) [Methylibium rhizosphaerae]|uniref:asparagine synthase (glutamine-hydrolyzing) n=1 Tax=Methylibium rhizosphaerae TaxID=2570323 RepID=UPI00112CCC27|nr:asparagine synthase (glutamine-hydrolyzing) [Methylibium rhizosphaerae]